MSALARSKVDNRLRLLREIVADNADSMGMKRDKWLKTRYWHMKRALGFYYARLLMRWNDPDTCHLDELELAIEDFYQRKEEGLRAKHDVVSTIIRNTGVCEAAEIDSERWKFVPQAKSNWLDLLLDVLDESEQSSLTHDPIFVENMVLALRTVQADLECSTFVASVMERGIRMKQSTLQAALEAAKASQSEGLIGDIEMLMTSS
eukprot:Nitzschia sp. Nitz4//scaffold119_size111653//16006//16620//NITZ4_004177-RA/size111653-exonerate_protein2genome-gene-0.3-mRNA-1//1//CDS//3329533797//1507//frame0